MRPTQYTDSQKLERRSTERRGWEHVARRPLLHCHVFASRPEADAYAKNQRGYPRTQSDAMTARVYPRHVTADGVRAELFVVIVRLK